MSKAVVEYYTLQKVTVDKSVARITTSALLQCDLCGSVIDTSGGPGHGTLCTKCAELVQNGGARGCVIWEEPTETTKSIEEPQTSKEKENMQRQNSKLGGFTGDMCPECGSFAMVRNGTCQKCQVCGATTGCS